MKIASITLPACAMPGQMYTGSSEKQNALSKGHEAIKQQLAEGFTRVQAKGSWRSPEGVVMYEDVLRYEFASPKGEQAKSDLRALAFRVKTITDEQSIMIVHANGDVEFI